MDGDPATAWSVIGDEVGPLPGSPRPTVEGWMTFEGAGQGSSQREADRLAAARTGDDDAFAALTQPLQRELHVHCYRMLGSLDDADDALQETLLRAWRQLDRFEPRAPFRAWLYRIATNVCLTMLARRARRGETSLTALDGTGGGHSRREDGAVQLSPYPDRLLDELATRVPGPEATIERRESVELAFVAAVQFLPSRQRAVLLLRDVIGYSASEVAAILATSVPGVNSALQRARVTLEREREAGRVTRGHARTGTVNEQVLVRRLTDAWQAADIPSIVAVLTTNALLTMPPEPIRYAGREAIGAFLATGLGGSRLDQFRFVPAAANRQPAVAAYYRNGDAGPFAFHAVVVLAVEPAGVASIVRFADPALVRPFRLPLSLPAH